MCASSAVERALGARAAGVELHRLGSQRATANGQGMRTVQRHSCIEPR